MADENRFLVTGGAGFIGWRVCKILSDRGHRLAIVDNLSIGMPMPDDKRYETHEADIRDASDMDAIVQQFRPDTIIHLAAVHHIPTCEKKRSYALGVNVVGTENMLAAAEKYGVRTFLLASSGAVYDWIDDPLNEETTPLWPCDNYALSKLTNERQVRFWGDRTGGRVRIARIFNTIGYDDPNAHLIPDILNQLYKASTKVTIRLGNLAPRRDYIYADDTAAGIAAMAQDSSKKHFDTMNVATGREISVEELVRKIGFAMGVDIEIESDPARTRSVDRMRQLGKVEHIRARLGWSAKTELDAAIADIVAKFPFANASVRENA